MLDHFLMGAIGMGFGIAGLFFLQYWRESHDRFFAWFALAFFVLAANRVLLIVLRETHEETALVPYLVRLLAFGVILLAVLDKNLRRT